MQDAVSMKKPSAKQFAQMCNEMGSEQFDVIVKAIASPILRKAMKGKKMCAAHRAILKLWLSTL